MSDPARLIDPLTRQLRAITRVERQTAHIIPEHVAAVIAIEEGGPTRFVFTGGGHLDVCGDAEWWRRSIALAMAMRAFS